MRNRRMVYGHALYQRAPKTLALTGVCIAVLAAWQPWTRATDTVDPLVAVTGSWDGPYCWPIGATHLAHLPPSGESQIGRMLMFPAQGNESGDDNPDSLIRAWLWNPQAGCFGNFDPEAECFTKVTNNTTNIFCAGQTALADGTILTAGGHRGSFNGANVGLPDTNHFIRDPFTGEWGVWKTFEDGMPEMVQPRWYPTVTTLPDGRALVVSGSDSLCSGNGEQCDPENPLPGNGCPANETCDVVIVSIPEIYDPAADPLGWTQLAIETDVPFYPFNFVLPDGTVLYAGADGKGAASVETTQTWVLDVDADPVTWTQKGNSTIAGGSAVMFTVPGAEGCPDEWKVLKSGGGDPAVKSAAVYDSTAGTWMDVAPMKHERRLHQLTLLPDGTVLATGGTQVQDREYASSCDGGTIAGRECSSVEPLLPNCRGNRNTVCPVACVKCGENGSCVGGDDAGEDCTVDTECADNNTCDGGPKVGLACNEHDDCPGEHACIEGRQLWVAIAEIYDPVKDKWTDMAEAKHPRMYHSTALLLPDGRVVSAGGGPFGGLINEYRTVEFFSPPYYFKERPEITSAPSTICYDETFQMTSPDAVDVTRVTLIRLGTTTHSFDSDQRFQELTIANQGSNVLNVVAPENANVAPPGYYMLFVITKDEAEKDVPSVGEYVQVVDCCIPTITIPGPLVFDDTCVGEESTATLDVCNTGCANLEVTSIISSDPRFSATEPSSGFPVVISPDFCFPFQVTFAPSGPGPQSAVLAVSSNDPTAPTVQVQAAGNGTEPDIDTLIADNGDFGDVCLGDFKDLNLTIINSGRCPLTVRNITSDSTEFQPPRVMSFPLVIGPKNSLAVPIRFEPTGPFGPRNATILIISNDPDTPDKEVDVTGNVPPGDIRVTGSTDFGQVCEEDLDLAEKTVSVCNVGACNLNVSDVSIVDCPDGDFTLINNPFPAPVSPDSCLDVVVAFTPSSCGPKMCRLRIRSDDPDSDEENRTLTGHTPCASIDVPPDVCFPPTVIQAVDACGSEEPFPVSNTGECNLTITNFEIALDPEEYSLTGLPSFPIILQEGHIAGAGDLGIVFAPAVLEPDPLQREHLGEVSVTYVSDPTTGDEITVSRNLCGESVRTGARVLVTHNGVPVDVVKSIRLLRINANRRRPRLNTVDVARNLALQTVTPSAPCPCPEFQFHREYGTVDNPIQLLPGSYEVSVMVRIDGKMRRQTAGFRVASCGFNPNIVVDF